MERGKENVNRSPPKSRIPLLRRPSVQQKNHPEYVTYRQSFANENNNRRALETINHHNIQAAGPSHVNMNSKLAFPKNLDTKHVTFRHNYYTVFQPDQTFSNTMTTRDEIKVSKAKDTKSDRNTNENCRIEVEKVVTPTLLPSTSAENIRVKNIKKSLRRPSSRELQGISPQRKKSNENLEVSYGKRYTELLKDRVEPPDFVYRSYMTCLAKDYVTDMYNYLLEVEKKPLDLPNVQSAIRACLINWMIKVNGMNGSPATVQTACWYLDSILGTAYVEPNNLQLIATACYWIAQKLHGPFMTAPVLVRCANNSYTSQKLLAAEKAILVRLDFPPQPVVPQDFINYLAWWCDNECPGELELAATFLCMSGLMVDKALCLEYPSVIAVAAVRNAVLLYKGKKMMSRLMECPLYTLVEKKAENFPRTCSMLRRAVRTLASPDYEYKAPYEQFAFTPYNIAQKVVRGAINLYEGERKKNKRL